MDDLEQLAKLVVDVGLVLLVTGIGLATWKYVMPVFDLTILTFLQAMAIGLLVIALVLLVVAITKE